ncbi:MAG: hypothetical protein ACNI27_04120 [Desulfovibrio sp.]
MSRSSVSDILDTFREGTKLLREHYDREALVRTAYYGLFCVICFIGFLGVFFLEEKATPMLTEFVEKQKIVNVKLHDPQISFFPPTLRARQININKTPIQQLKPQIIKNVKLTIAWEDLLLFKLGAKLQAENLAGGSANLHIRTTSLWNTQPDMIVADVNNLTINKLINKIPLLGVPQGTISGVFQFGGFDATNAENDVDNLFGYANITLKNWKSNNIIPIFKAKQLIINNGRLDAEWDDGQLTLRNLKLNAQNFTTELSGEARLTKPFMNSVVDFRGNIAAKPADLHVNLLDPPARKALQKNKSINIRMSEKIGSPVIRML